MAKGKLNPALERLRGQVGELVFKQYGDKLVVSRRPDMSRVKWSRAQRAGRERFQEAILYARRIKADAPARAAYEAAAQRKGKRAWNLMIADFLNPPVVDEIDARGYDGKAGDCLQVRAHDDFEVLGVTVMLATVEGAILEQGAAVETPRGSGCWVYAATTDVLHGTTVRITATATDRPGHAGIKEESKSVV